MSDTDSIRDSIKRYKSLRLHNDETFHKKYRELQDWKLGHAMDSYAQQLADPDTGELVRFYLREALTGLHMPELRRISNIGKLAEKLLTGTDMARVGLEFNALTFEVGERLTTQIFEVMEAESVNDGIYVEACHLTNVFDDTERQLELFQKFAVFLDEAITDRVVITGFKVAKIPARLAGFKKTYKLAREGFKLAKRSGDPQSALLAIVTHERQVLENIRGRSEEIFFPCEAG